jgi:hypothetical protein
MTSDCFLYRFFEAGSISLLILLPGRSLVHPDNDISPTSNCRSWIIKGHSFVERLNRYFEYMAELVCSLYAEVGTLTIH